MLGTDVTMLADSRVGVRDIAQSPSPNGFIKRRRGQGCVGIGRAAYTATRSQSS
jgi:hypothetical protein